jgi:hypothetical protein
MTLNRLVFLNCILFATLTLPASSQVSSGEAKSRVDAAIVKAYDSASAKFPCKLTSSGKAKMLSWQRVAECLNYAYDRVDWEDISRQLQAIRKESGFPASDILSMAERSLATHALPYDKVFKVKEMRATLPLSSSLLKFLPEGSLQDLPVIEKSGTKMGTFAGIYTFEKMGEISGAKSQLIQFQYADFKGNIHGSPERLLLDSFGVPWKEAMSQPGFRMPPNKIVLR